MVHFIGADKPWTDTAYQNVVSKFYYKRYALECQKNEYVSNNFRTRIQKKVDNIYL